MKKAKAARVPILENAFEVNLPKLMKVARATGPSQLVVQDGEVRTVVMLTDTRLAIFLGDRSWVVEIVSVQCLNGRVRPLLKCPRAHEGNFQSLYYRAGELACRRCHCLRYRSTLATSATERARIARFKLLAKMGGTDGMAVAPKRRPSAWRRTYLRMVMRLAGITNTHYSSIRDWLERGGEDRTEG